MFFKKRCVTKLQQYTLLATTQNYVLNSFAINCYYAINIFPNKRIIFSTIYKILEETSQLAEEIKEPNS